MLGVSKSELIRKSIAAYIEKVNKPSPCELGRGVFGEYSSGKGSLAKGRKAIFKADACLVHLGEKLNIYGIATIDRDFDVYRMRGKKAFKILLR